MKYRLFNKKNKLYTDDIMWPNNQRTHEIYFLDIHGKVNVLIGYEEEGYLLQKCNQEDWKIEFIK